LLVRAQETKNSGTFEPLLRTTYSLLFMAIFCHWWSFNRYKRK